MKRDLNYRKIKKLLPIIALTVAVVAVFYLINNKTLLPEPLTYRNEEYGFEVSLPWKNQLVEESDREYLIKLVDVPAKFFDFYIKTDDPAWVNYGEKDALIFTVVIFKKEGWDFFKTSEATLPEFRVPYTGPLDLIREENGLVYTYGTMPGYPKEINPDTHLPTKNSFKFFPPLNTTNNFKNLEISAQDKLIIKNFLRR